MGEKQPDEHIHLLLLSRGPAMADTESHCLSAPLITDVLRLQTGRQLCLKSLLLVKPVKETIAGGGVFFKGSNVRDARPSKYEWVCSSLANHETEDDKCQPIEVFH